MFPLFEGCWQKNRVPPPQHNYKNERGYRKGTDSKEGWILKEQQPQK